MICRGFRQFAHREVHRASRVALCVSTVRGVGSNATAVKNGPACQLERLAATAVSTLAPGVKPV